MTKLKVGRIILAIAIAGAVTHGAAILIIDAGNRSYAKGREYGQCEVVIALDASMRRRDAAWASPQKLIARCTKALGKHKPFEVAGRVTLAQQGEATATINRVTRTAKLLNSD